MFLSGVIPVDRIVENASGFFMANQWNPLLILGVIAGVLSLIVWDLQTLKQHAWLFGSQEPS
jgi:hypothetical protein